MRIGGQATPPATAVSSENDRSRLLAWRQSLALIVSAGPVLVVGVAVLSVIMGATPAALAVVTGRLIDALPRAVRAGTWAGLSGSLILVASLAVAREVALSAQEVAAGHLRDRLTALARERVGTALGRQADLSHLDDPVVAGAVRALRERIRWEAGDTATGGSLVLAALAQGVAAGVVVASWSWVAAVGLGAVWLGVRIRLAPQFVTGLWNSLDAHDDPDRLFQLAVEPAGAKELRLFAVHGWLGHRHLEAWSAARMAMMRHGRRARREAVLALGLVVLVNAGVLVALADRASSGNLSIGRVAAIVQAIFAMVALGEVGNPDAWLSNGLQRIGRVIAVETLVTRTKDKGDANHATLRRPTPKLEQGIAIRGLRFRYPGREADCLVDLDLDIPAGSSVALVGANGAGKSTLVSVLCGLRRPTGGRVEIDGIDLAAIDLKQWQAQVAALFQDFVRYPLSAADNVGLGAPALASDQAQLATAVRLAGAHDVVESLPSGWSTPLRADLAGGVDLSGGEWQRIALARALLAVEAGARLLILDEPAAALDVRGEADLHDRFFEITHGLTTLVVSHRFSTVRRADRIIVLDHGQVAEAGSHDQLMAIGGRYARMFELQASRLRAGEDR